ncbi:MAG: chromate transporter [Roseateles depolymerans]|uniref:Chromate transporter n=1 Tax=Roseateles depolymerans TaxID=76731 RepID=A0A2W5DFQ2_9BURK|nr:MAG: chromate transporter [Roseateles depolymerans]
MTDRAAAPGFWTALRFWAWLGCVSFGGPAGQIALMHAELVERRRWISERRFVHALNYCMLLPGPEAQQLATYLGWLMHRTAGGVAAGVLFVLPSLVLLVGLSWLYMAQGQHPLVAGLFDGLKPAVLVLVIQAAQRLGSRVLDGPLHWAIAAGALLAVGGLGLPFPLVVLAAGLIGHLAARPGQPPAKRAAAHGARPAPTVDTEAWISDHSPTPPHARFSRRRLLRVLLAGAVLFALPYAALWLWGGPVLTAMAGFFTRAALVTFGGAYAVLPYVFQGAVEQQHWLSAAQMMDGLALGETTPGPLIMVVAFVGFAGGWHHAALGSTALVAGGLAGALVATWFTFLPSFVFILAGGPLIESTQRMPRLTAALGAVTAAAVGVILSLALLFAAQVLWPGGAFRPGAALLALAATLALLRWRMGVLPLLAVCGGLGIAARLLG